MFEWLRKRMERKELELLVNSIRKLVPEGGIGELQVRKIDGALVKETIEHIEDPTGAGASQLLEQAAKDQSKIYVVHDYLFTAAPVKWFVPRRGLKPRILYIGNWYVVDWTLPTTLN